MKTKYFFIAALAGMTLASCSSEDFVGDLSPSTAKEANGTEAINFGFSIKNATRGDIAGKAAADLLGSNFYVTGTKGTEAATYPTPTLVFDNYLVHYTANTAGTTESNTANWEYVGVVPGTSPTDKNAKIGSYNSQTIKYWDYSVPQYDFFGFSTGTFAAVSGSSTGDTNIGVTAMKYGANLANSNIAYTFDIPSVDAIKITYITDIVEVKKEDNAYGKDVTLRFKNLGSKVRVALYETVPGYQVTDVVFYAVDGTTGFDDTKSTEGATLISADANGLPTKGTIAVYFPHVGDNNASEQDYNKAAATVTPVTASSTKTLTFGDLYNFETTKEGVEPDNDGASPTPNAYHYIGRTLPTATFAGLVDAQYYQTVFPVSDSDPLTLRVDYKLVSIDGSNEVINVYGAKAVVPATYTKWLPNYAYTYIFKISDNTNGWTSQVGTDPQGLFPITFDAVVTEPTDATGEQTTVTTVATPTITTYQQNHKPFNTDAALQQNEYSKATGKNIYVQVMDNNLSPAVLVGTGDSKLPLLNAAVTNLTPKYQASLLYSVDDDATEAMVMDALENRKAEVGDYNTNVVGRNNMTLTYDANINNTVTKIVNGVDDNKITVTAGQAAEIAISGLSAGTYAYVYDYTWQAESNSWNSTTTTYNAKHNTKVYQSIAVTENVAIGTSGDKFCSITTDVLKNQDTYTTAGDNVEEGYLYFSKTNKTLVLPETNPATYTYTYSFVNVDGKKTLPAGLLKVSESELTQDVDGSNIAVAGTFYFTKYFRNNGKYAVKVIKIQ